MVPGRSYLVGVKIARSDRPLLVHLQRRVVARSGVRVHQLAAETNRRRVDDPPVGHAAQDARKQLLLTLASSDRPGEQHGQDPLQRLREPAVERTALHLRRGVLQVRAKHVVLPAPLVRAAGENERDQQLGDVELSVPLLNAVLLDEAAEQRGIERCHE